MPLKVGDTAPDFELPAVEGERHLKIKLSDFRGKKNVVVSFHPLDWTPTCAAQVPAFDADRDKFAGLDAQVVDISVDSIPSKIAWQKKEIGTDAHAHVRGFLSSRRSLGTVWNPPQGATVSRHL